MLQITIPTPCHEDWNNMNPNNQGRHCNSCMKTVVDFTSMSDDEVKNFLLNKKEETVCGRFNNQQLRRIEIELPLNIFQLQMPWWKRFLVASLIVFSTTLFSCDVKHTQTGAPDIERTVGTIAIAIDTLELNTIGDTTIINKPIDKIDENIEMGEVAPVQNTTTVPPVCNPADTIVGKLIYIPAKHNKPTRTGKIIKGRVRINKKNDRN